MTVSRKRGRLLVLYFLLNVVLATSSKLPKFVDQQLNNQANEGLSDVIIPLQSIPCSEKVQIDCFRIKRSSLSIDNDNDWRFMEFQVSSHPSATEHRFKLIAYSRMLDSVIRDPIIFESAAVRPDPILMDLIIDISLAKEIFLQQKRSFYLLLVCEDCNLKQVSGKSDDGIGFLIIKKSKGNKRSKRSATSSTNECRNHNPVVNCCLQKVTVDKTIIFENSSKIVAPNTIPVTYCRGSCYLDMYDGNHNYALLRYYQSLTGSAKSRMRELLPCCSARDFRDLVILYEMPNGSHEMVVSARLVIDSCRCL